MAKIQTHTHLKHNVILLVGLWMVCQLEMKSAVKMATINFAETSGYCHSCAQPNPESRFNVLNAIRESLWITGDKLSMLQHVSKVAKNVCKSYLMLTQSSRRDGGNERRRR
jgi:hypothetical protein